MKPIRILIVEDEEIVAMDIESRLEVLGYTAVGHTATGERAVELARELRPDLVLMDIRLRGEMDGIAAAGQIRSRFQLPVIFLTAHSEGTTLERAKLTEPFGYILKPFEDRELRTVIEMALYKHRAEREILHVNRLYAVLSQVNQSIVRARDTRLLCTEVCDLVVRFGRFPAVWIAEYTPDQAAMRMLDLAAGEAGLQEELRVILSDSMSKMFPVATWLEQKVVRLTFDPAADSGESLEVFVRRHGFCELAAAAIRLHGNTWGLLCIHASEAGFFGEKECGLVAEIALDLGFAMENLEREIQRQAAEAALHQERDRLRQILDAQFGFVAVMETDGTIVEVNQAPLALMGLGRADVLGRVFWEVGWLEPVSVPPARAAVAAAARGETVRNDILACFPKSGQRDVDAVFTPLRNASGEVVNVVSFGVDITERKRAEEARRLSEETLKRAQGVAHMGSWQLDIRNNVLCWSDEAYRMFGIPQGQPLTSESFLACVHPEDRDRVSSEWNAALRGATYDIEHRIVVGRQVKWVRECAEVTFDAQGNAVSGIGTVQDITERKQAEEAALAQEKRFRYLIEHSTDIVSVLASDGTIKYTSPAFTGQLGFAVEDWVGRSVFDLIWQEDLATTHALFRESLASPGKVIHWQLRLHHADGTLRWLEGTGTNLISDPTIGGIVINCHDITERKQAGERIRQQAALIEATHDAILVWDEDRGIQFMNSAAEKLTGWTLAQAMAHDLSEVLRPRHELTLRAALHAVNTSGSWTGELSLLTGNDNIRDVDSRWTVVAGGAANNKSVLITCNDITERKQYEHQYLRAQRLESVGTLASGVAHDLNNILSPIIMGVELMSSMSGDDETRGVLAMMQESARRGRDTVMQLLTFARGGQSQKGPVQPRHLLKEIARLLQQTFPKNIQIYIDHAEEPATVLADPSQLHQVLMNLCVNARDAMPDGGVLYLTLARKKLDATTANLHPKARPGVYVVFQVSDSGVGIPPDVVDRIFDPFFTTKPQGMGTGLGLATVLGIVENHGGFVTVESRLGRGTTFEVYIPSSSAAEREGASAAPRSPLKGMGELVLIVDDEPPILRMAESILSRNGYETLAASNASEAMQLFEENRERLRAVLTDIMMPFGDGRQLVGTLRELDPHLPIIAMSGHATREFQRETLARGAQAFISKPFGTEQLLATLSELLKSKTA